MQKILCCEVLQHCCFVFDGYDISLCVLFLSEDLPAESVYANISIGMSIAT